MFLKSTTTLNCYMFPRSTNCDPEIEIHCMFLRSIVTPKLPYIFKVNNDPEILCVFKVRSNPRLNH